MLCICYKGHRFSPPPWTTPQPKPPSCVTPIAAVASRLFSPLLPCPLTVLNTTARVMLQNYVTSRYLSASPPTRGETQRPVLCDVTSCSHPLLSPLSHPASLVVLEHARQNPAPGPLHLLLPQAEKPFSQVATHFPTHPGQTFIHMAPSQGGSAWAPRHSSQPRLLPHPVHVSLPCFKSASSRPNIFLVFSPV